MKSDRTVPVAIIGAGFSGTMVAANLARRGIRSVLIESDRRAGLGTAFSTTDPVHLLNIPAETMGAWPENPGDFAQREGIAAGIYAERRRFGRYLRAILDEAIASGHARVLDGRPVRASRTPDGWSITLDEGDSICAEALVLATGNQPPARPAELEPVRDLLIEDPWSAGARSAIAEAVARREDVLILGTSLTMIDIALSLDSAGHRGRIVALSRRGKLPLSNGSESPAAVEYESLPPLRVRDIVRWLRRRSAQVGWRPAVDSLRPHSHRLWQSLPDAQKRLFLKHGRPWWDIHRHRIAPEIGERIAQMVARGRLEVIAGRVVEARLAGDAVEVTIRRRGEDQPQPPQRFGRIFTCTGPLGDISRTESPLLRQLLDEGLAVPDQLSIGLSVDERSRVQGSRRLWAVGTLTKGRYWEIIAIPDIRTQAADIAEDIATELGQ